MKKVKNKSNKIRVLAWCDSPAVATGFATVSRGVLDYLASTGKYDIDVIGINDRGGWKNPQRYPYRIYPARVPVSVGEADYYGRPRLVSSVLSQDPDTIPPWDIIWTLNDPFILEQPLPVFKKGALAVLHEARDTISKSFPPEWMYKIISYFPIDSDVKENWVDDSIAHADYPVMYTEYGKQEVIKALSQPADRQAIEKKMTVIPHGFNQKVFKYLKDRKEVAKFRKDFFDGRVADDMFLVVAVARNQMRKDLPRTLKIFKEFLRRRPKSFLYLHSQETDAFGSLREFGRAFNLEYGKDWGVPAKFSSNTGFPIEAVNMVYNAADAVISTSLGEGLGFYNLEAMATKTPVIAPAHTSHIELFDIRSNDDLTDMDALSDHVRGIPMRCGTTSSEWTTFGGKDFERIRPTTNVDDGVKKLVWTYDNRNTKVKDIVDRAHTWVQDLTWDKIGPQWDRLFQSAYKQLEQDRKVIAKVQQDASKKPKTKAEKAREEVRLGQA